MRNKSKKRETKADDAQGLDEQKKVHHGSFSRKLADQQQIINNLFHPIQRKWIMHMVLKKDGFSDPDGIKLRAVKGIKGCAYLEVNQLMNSLSYVMGPLADTLKVSNELLFIVMYLI